MPSTSRQVYTNCQPSGENRRIMQITATFLWWLLRIYVHVRKLKQNKYSDISSVSIDKDHLLVCLGIIANILKPWSSSPSNREAPSPNEGMLLIMFKIQPYLQYNDHQWKIWGDTNVWKLILSKSKTLTNLHVLWEYFIKQKQNSISF